MVKSKDFTIAFKIWGGTCPRALLTSRKLFSLLYAIMFDLERFISEINGAVQSITRVSKFSCIVYSCISCYYSPYVFSCINKVFLLFSCMYFRVPINIFIFPYMYFRVSIFIFIFFCYISCISSCINVKAYFVLSEIYYIPSLKSQFRQKFLKIKQIIGFINCLIKIYLHHS